MAYKEVSRSGHSRSHPELAGGQRPAEHRDGDGAVPGNGAEVSGSCSGGVVEEGPSPTEGQLSVLASVSRSGPRTGEAPSVEPLAP